jgi:hypothetical protein
MFIQLPFGIQLHAYSGDNWSHFKACVVTGYGIDGVQRETALQAGFKSDHLLEALGEENSADVATVNGTTYYGRTVRAINGDTHRISAIQVAARVEHNKALKTATQAAVAAANATAQPSSNGAKPAAEAVAA